VDLIRTDVSEDRIASIFRVYEYRLESVPIQELTASLCNLLALVHPDDGGDTRVCAYTRAYNFAL
jgi:hypothetical protein